MLLSLNILHQLHTIKLLFWHCSIPDMIPVTTPPPPLQLWMCLSSMKHVWMAELMYYLCSYHSIFSVSSTLSKFLHFWLSWLPDIGPCKKVVATISVSYHACSIPDINQPPGVPPPLQLWMLLSMGHVQTAELHVASVCTPITQYSLCSTLSNSLQFWLSGDYNKCVFTIYPRYYIDSPLPSSFECSSLLSKCLNCM